MYYCKHYDCRCVRAEELARTAERTGNGHYLAEAIKVHEQEVLCRRDPYRYAELDS